MSQLTLDYGTRPSRMNAIVGQLFTRRMLLILVLAVVAGAIGAVTVPISGRKLVGFNYRATDDNQFTVCPDRVVGQSGVVFTLASGERFRALGASPQELTAVLLQSSGFVKVDRRYNELSIRKLTASCGCRPQNDQLFTIPLRATERVDLYYAQDVGEVEPVAAAGG